MSNEVKAFVSRESEIDKKIEQAARRISSGKSAPNDYSNISDLIRERVKLMTPPALRQTIKK